MTEPIVHIAARADWERAIARGSYEPPGLAQEGFVHCSFAHQVVEVADAVFAGRTDLVLLVIDPDRLSSELRVERPVPDPGPGAPLFPHVYGPIDPVAVIEVVDLPTGPDGTFRLPPRLGR